MTINEAFSQVILKDIEKAKKTNSELIDSDVVMRLVDMGLATMAEAKTTFDRIANLIGQMAIAFEAGRLLERVNHDPVWELERARLEREMKDLREDS